MKTFTTLEEYKQFHSSYEAVKEMQESGNTLAHEQVIMGWKPHNKEILMLENESGTTVAEFLMMMGGWRYMRELNNLIIKGKNAGRYSCQISNCNYIKH